MIALVPLVLALHVAALAPAPGAALPITSKPIENTAENLAWQAWLMLPPEQKNLEKSRKVTPKSIFTLPFRDCPPGHQLFESRCIPTVSVDQTQLLTEQLLGFVGGDGGGGGANYEFDYDDSDGGEEEAVLIYEPPQKLSGEGASPSYDDASQLPSLDAPLKFNIFQQKFPTDYEAEGETKVSSSSASAGANGTAPAPAPSTPRTSVNVSGGDGGGGMFSATQFLEAVNGYLQRQANRTAPLDRNATGQVGSFALGEIDAIALPAQGASPAAGQEPQASHKISLFKDDSAVQLVTAGLAPADGSFGEETAAATQSEIAQLLQADALLPLFNVTQTQTAAEQSSAPTEEEVTATGEDAAATEDTTLSTPGGGGDDDDGGDKDERPRSVSDRAVVGEPDLGQEATFTTTTEPEATTSIQLDETTIIETHDSPTNARQELLPRSEPAPPPPPSASPDAAAEPKKSKVEPVLGATATPLRSVTASVAGGAAPAEDADDVDDGDDYDDVEEGVDRFFNRHSSSDGDGAAESNEIVGSTGSHNKAILMDLLKRTAEAATTAALNKSATTTTTTTTTAKTTTTTATSEIDTAAEELRIINELVKGSGQQQQPPQPELAAPATKATIADEETPTIKNEKSPTTSTATSTTREATTRAESRFATDETETETKTKTKTEETKATTTATAMAMATTKTRTDPRSALNNKIETSSAGDDGDRDDDASHGDGGGGGGDGDGDDEVSTSKNTTPLESGGTGSSAATTARTSAAGDGEDDAAGASLWSKIMPILGFAATERSAAPELPSWPATSKTPTTTPTTTPTVSSAGSNRSHRNSKISRLGATATPSFEGDWGEESTPAAPTTTSGDLEPFWWLPTGWRLDRKVASVESQSLLLRLWSAFPGNQARGAA